MFDAMLYGHDDWVHSVSWAPPSKTTHHQPLLLVSASADKSIMLWAPDKETGIWTHVARMGDVGGSTLGFIAARFVGDSDSVAAIAYSGALHKWDKKTKKKKKKTVDSQIEEEEDEEAGGRVWIPQIGRGGHNRAVRDISWDPTGKYFVSVSIDETARLYAPWKKAVDGDGGGGKKSKEMWYEMARPQIHGYPLQCLAFVHGFGYVSGADEKVN